MGKPYVLVPVTISDANLTSATIAEPAAGETAWVSGGTYAVDDERILVAAHRVYSCVQAHTGRSVSPEADPAYWLEKRPTQRYAVFDGYRNTKSLTTGTWTYVIRPGFFNALGFFGLVGGTLTVVIKDGPGGAVADSVTVDLTEPYTGFYELLTRAPRQRSTVMLRDLPLLPDPELTITIAAGSGVERGAGMVAIGDLTPLVDELTWAGVEAGAQAKPKTYSYFKNNADGSVEIKRGLSATDISISIAMPISSADAVLATVQEVLDVPCAWATDADGYSGLTAFGLGTGTLTYSPEICKFQIDVKGYI